MQIQTTTITTETQNVFGQNFVINTYEQTITVFCDCCEATQTGTKAELEGAGWLLVGGAEFCDQHSY